jgi:Phage portal protein
MRPPAGGFGEHPPLHVYRGDDRDPIPTPPLLARPSADFDELGDWLWAVMASLLLRGNAWGVITARTGTGMLPAQVDLVDPGRVAVTTEKGRRVIRIGGQPYDRADLFHVKAFTWPGNLEGLSPIAYARESIGLGLGSERWAARFYGDSAIPSGVLTSVQRINAQQAETLQARREATHKGKRRIAVLGDGARFQALTVAPADAALLESQRFNVETICRVFGVPSEMMNGPTAGHEAYTSPRDARHRLPDLHPAALAAARGAGRLWAAGHGRGGGCRSISRRWSPGPWPAGAMRPGRTCTTASRASTSERATTPGRSPTRGRSPDRAGHAIQPSLRGRWPALGVPVRARPVVDQEHLTID